MLHAKVKEYPKCFAIASIWLKSSDNVSKYGYIDVAVLYITHVLVPQGQYSVAMQFLSSYTHLDTNIREKILRETDRLKGQDINSKNSSLDKATDDEEEFTDKQGNTKEPLANLFHPSRKHTYIILTPLSPTFI